MDSERLKAWAETNGITPHEIARKTGYKFSTVLYFLEGYNEITPKFKWHFLEGFGPEAAASAFGLSDPAPEVADA